MPKAKDLCTVAPKYLGVPYSKMDCQAFVEKCLSDIGISENLPGSNAWFRRMTWTGTPEECKKSFGAIPPGAFLFILKHDGNEPGKYRADGIGNASHIGIYTGMTGAEMCAAAAEAFVEDAEKYNFGNGAINSSSSRGFVCTSKFTGKSIDGGWNRVGLWDRLTYEFTLPGGGTYGGEGMTATVTAPSGSTVKMRQQPSTDCRIYWEVPVGDRVTISGETGDWAAVSWGGKSGYMQKRFLQESADPAPAESVTVSRAWLENIYNEIGDALGLRG